MNDSMLRKAENVTPPAKDVVKRKYCAKCQNHQRMEEVKGHKRHCTFQWCRCDKCRSTDEKRKITARNVQAKREEILEKEKAAARNLNEELDRKDGVRSVEDRVKSRGEDSRDHLSNSVHFEDSTKDARQSSAHKDDSKTISPPVKKVKIWNEKGPEKAKVEWKSIITLCDDIKGLEIHHLLHLILKEIAPTVEEARYRIIQGLEESVTFNS